MSRRTGSSNGGCRPVKPRNEGWIMSGPVCPGVWLTIQGVLHSVPPVLPLSPSDVQQPVFEQQVAGVVLGRMKLGSGATVHFATGALLALLWIQTVIPLLLA
jgi:hypothetical protein